MIGNGAKIRPQSLEKGRKSLLAHKLVLLQTMKTHIKCCRTKRFIVVCIVFSEKELLYFNLQSHECKSFHWQLKTVANLFIGK